MKMIEKTVETRKVSVMTTITLHIRDQYTSYSHWKEYIQRDQPAEEVSNFHHDGKGHRTINDVIQFPIVPWIYAL